MIAILLGLLLPAALGIVWLRFWLAPYVSKAGALGLLFPAALGVPFGFGVASCIFFLLRTVQLANSAVILGAELFLLAGGIYLLWKGPGGGSKADLSMPATWVTWLLAASALACLAIFVSGFFEAAQLNPQGNWDAWAIWNLRAKFLAANGDSWRVAVSPLLDKTHPDYPLLLSSLVARSWVLSGNTEASAPIGLALSFGLVAFVLMATSVAVLRGPIPALAAALVLLSAKTYTAEVSSEYSDVPLSVYMLASLAAAVLALREGGSRRLLALAGCFASFAAWTKNEGLAFLLICTVIISILAGTRGLLPFLAGAVPVGLLVVVFKLFLAPPADPMVRQGLSALFGRVAELGRYPQIVRTFFARALDLDDPLTHPAILLAVAAAMLGKETLPDALRRAWLPTAVVLAMLASYFAAFVVTPSDLVWHLDTATSRLLVQVVPISILAVFLWLGSGDPVRAVTPAAKEKRRRKR
jgi:hypothetical protein